MRYYNIFKKEVSTGKTKLLRVVKCMNAKEARVSAFNEFGRGMDLTKEQLIVKAR